MWPPRGRLGHLLGGKYRVEELLALGGMGVVYSGRHELTRRPVAIKLLRPELAARPDLLRRVAAEARLAVEASHPNVVEVLDAGADDLGTPYLILERLYGKPLEALIGERLSLLATARALLPVMNALAELHGAGIVHRDIKPSNIFLSCEGGRVTPKLLDFGIAKELSAGASDTSIALGTPSYMAPEQALGYRALVPATDVWSMGIVVVRCLTGRLPFESLPMRGPSLLGSGLQPDQWAHVPESVGRVLVRALQLDPRDRFRDMADFRGALLEGLRRVHERESWPSEATVSYSMAELAGGELAFHWAADARAEGERDERPARPCDVSTRTQSKVAAVISKPAWKRAATGAALALAVSTGAFLAWRPSGAPVIPSSGTHASMAATGVHTVVESSSSVNPDGASAERAALDEPPAKGDDPESSPVRSSLQVTAPPLRSPRRLPAARTLGSSTVESPSVLSAPLEPELGPNRAPIIE